MKKNNLVVLGLLKEQPMHGYQMDQEIKLRHMDTWANINMASIYNTLIKLEEKGFINSKKEKVGKMPSRNVYKITSKGEKELINLIKEGLLKVAKDNDVVFHLSVGFMPFLSQSDASKALVKRKEQIESLIKMVKELYEIHEEIVPFNWLYIIENSLEKLKVALKTTNGLSEKILKVNDWGVSYEK
jgi:DNA-binding PadR family transcriptional regulator